MINIDYGDLIVPKEIDEGIRKLILDIIHKSSFNYKEEEYKIKIEREGDRLDLRIEVGKIWGHQECPDYPGFYIDNKQYGYEVNGYLFHNNSPHYAYISLDELVVKSNNTVVIYDEETYYKELLEEYEVKTNI